MIRINLLPIRQTQKRQTVQQQLVVGAMCIFLTIVGSAGWYWKVSSDAAFLQLEIKRKTQELSQLDKIIGEINQLEKKKAELIRKQKIIEDLRRGKTGPVRAMDDLATLIPDRVWITKLTEADGSVTLEGKAITHENVSAFMKALQKSKYFTRVTLGYSKTSAKKTKGVTLYEFQIMCSVNYSA
ncbi:MAG: PilN domain-containing protein [Myxococcales bacterium]|nr:PilN domain-containing protein [Myxococcales bacterium]